MKLRTIMKLRSMMTAALAIYSVGALCEEKSIEKTTDKEEMVTAKRIQSTLPKEKADAIKLESVFVGDKEQPAISYFIPWQGIGTPDKLHWNVEQKHDGALDLVDREIMLRSMHIYEEMNLESPKQLD